MQERSIRWPLLGAALIAGLDQVIKAVVVAIQPQVTVIPKLFDIRMTTNTGIALSLLQDSPLLVTIVGILVLAALIGYLWQRVGTAARPERAAFGLLIGGAVGNLIDRLRFGYVIDFLDVYVGQYHWPTFNLADSAVSIGAMSLFIVTLRPPSAGSSSPGSVQLLARDDNHARTPDPDDIQGQPPRPPAHVDPAAHRRLPHGRRLRHDPLRNGPSAIPRNETGKEHSS